jgi:hypothetical protein
MGIWVDAVTLIMAVCHVRIYDVWSTRRIDTHAEAVSGAFASFVISSLLCVRI